MNNLAARLMELEHGLQLYEPGEPLPLGVRGVFNALLAEVTVRHEDDRVIQAILAIDVPVMSDAPLSTTCGEVRMYLGQMLMAVEDTDSQPSD